MALPGSSRPIPQPSRMINARTGDGLNRGIDLAARFGEHLRQATMIVHRRRDYEGDYRAESTVRECDRATIDGW